MRKDVLFPLVLLIAVLVAGCGPSPTPTAPAAPPALSVQGKVSRPLALSLEQIKALGLEKMTLEHPKNGPTEYEGVRLNQVLDQAAPAAEATTLVFTAADGFSAEVPLADVRACAECLVAISGTTLNLAMPGLPGKAWVRTVIGIEVK